MATSTSRDGSRFSRFAWATVRQGKERNRERSTLSRTPFVAEALDSIGAPRTADICRRAITIAFPAGLPSNPDAISAAAAEFSDEVMQNLGSFDNEFLAYPHNLTDLLFAFVSKHPEEFGELPKADDE